MNAEQKALLEDGKAAFQADDAETALAKFTEGSERAAAAGDAAGRARFGIYVALIEGLKASASGDRTTALRRYQRGAELAEASDEVQELARFERLQGGWHAQQPTDEGLREGIVLVRRGLARLAPDDPDRWRFLFEISNLASQLADEGLFRENQLAIWDLVPQLLAEGSEKRAQDAASLQGFHDYHAGVIAQSAGRFLEAEVALLAATRRFAGLERHEVPRAEALSTLGVNAMYLGRFRESRGALEESRGIHAQLLQDRATKPVRGGQRADVAELACQTDLDLLALDAVEGKLEGASERLTELAGRIEASDWKRLRPLAQYLGGKLQRPGTGAPDSGPDDPKWWKALSQSHYRTWCSLDQLERLLFNPLTAVQAVANG